MRNVRVELRQRAEKLKKEQIKKIRDIKIAALSDKLKQKRDAGIEKRKLIRLTRIKADEEDRLRRLAELKAHRKRDLEAEEVRMREQQQAVEKQLKLKTQTTASPATTSRERLGAKAQPPKREMDTVPTLSMLRQEVLEVVRMPSIETLACALQTSVAFADKRGISSWGDESGRWAHPSGWMKLIEQLNQVYRVPGSEPDWCQEVVNGESNGVLFGNSAHTADVPTLPPLRDRGGNSLAVGDVIFRLTRPDSDDLESGKGKFYRYKRLENLTQEIYYTLHGAVNGLAPECFAALLYPALILQTKQGPVQLYGSLYVMRRAKLDLGTLLDGYADNAKKHLDPSGMQYVDALRKSGRRVAVKLLPLIFRQSRLGVLSFDAKPGNYVLGSDAQPYAIDFDAAMYSLLPSSESYYWEANMLMNLTLLTAHVRCYRHPSLADGWASAIRELMIELCTHARGERWLYLARADSARKFKELSMYDPDSRSKVLEMVTHVYFVNPHGNTTTKFNMVRGNTAAPLIHQLVRYCLHGSFKHTDASLDRALGNPTQS